MNIRLSVFLELLEDYELAFFYKYRFNSFMEGSRNKILKEFEKRNIRIDSIDEIIRKHINDNIEKNSNACPRCKSLKYYTVNDKKLKIFKGFSYDKELIKYICQVCGYTYSVPKS